MFDKILIANRGETALRLHRACREMGVRTVAVHSEVDANAMHVRLADESVCIGPSPSNQSYLNTAAIISAAVVTNADAIHPGIGFLSENAAFAQMVTDHAITWIGPAASHIQSMGDKAEARRIAHKAGVPIIPGADISHDVNDATQKASTIGYPVMIKASAGGGGRGMKIAHNESELTELIPLARQEALKGFGDDTLYLEKFLPSSRHIEVQILADHHGTTLHLGERECSLQRRHQKVLEEAPSPALNKEIRDAICHDAVSLAQKIGYVSTGTIEFLFANGQWYFMEMNTRLQVEHPITEMITGIDLVREQINVAAHRHLELAQSDIELAGHAIECRINAEDPTNFTPAPGLVQDYHAPGGLGVRVDSALYAGYRIPPYYDSLIAKLITHGKTRNECLMRLKRALEEFVIDGIPTTIPLHNDLIRNATFLDCAYDTKWLEKWLEQRQNTHKDTS